MPDQLDMFGTHRSRPAGLGLAELPSQIHELGRQLPQHLRMGTSSWSFAGWTDLVWDRAASQRVIAKQGLTTYANHPLFRTVGLDRTYYAPMRADQLAALSQGLPDDFRLLVKAHAECTTVRFSNRSWHRGRAGQRNELFLEPTYATEVVVNPYMQGLGRHAGVLLFQFPAQSVPGGPKSFAHRLGEFLEALPKGPQYAVEIRNPDLLTPRYVSALERAGATHCVAELPGMPDVHKQWEVSGGTDRPALVMRWMLARHHNYESAREAYAPFDQLVDEHPQVRLAYANMIARSSKPAFMIVNNKAEGSSPLSVQRLAEQLMQLLS
ncbi:hypothetical protein DB30_02988 [Enhygromyxa salina]|uniref:DUF72 domain-containing protein n=1 Tax=Enhygromyxa salina TaxID=215803 RepID=A0A0C2A2X5_9BACT|nr:DUF72 domain-containing protein [Enhygromyxa salina]KIG17713.1 hypothetical protein DB30_02988 [Enhygromyxa salina]